MSSSPPDRRVLVSTLTPVLDEEAHLHETVAALRAQDVAEEAEFLFIDGGSTDRSKAILEELAREDPRIRVFDNPQRHTAAALNIGLRAARGEFVARVDAHTAYPPHYLSRGIERLREGGVAWVAGPQVPVGRDTWSSRVTLALRSPVATGGTGRWGSDADRRGGETELGTGVFTGVWRRETLDRFGGWDEGWPINQDAEMAARFLEAGERIVSLPDMGASYTPRSSLKALSRQYRRYGEYRAKTTLRHPWSLRKVQIALPGLVGATAAALVGPRVLRTPARAGLGLYALVLGAAAARSGAEDPRDAAALPAVFATMHLSWGVGFLIGLVRFANPATRRERLASELVARAGRG
jgi:glycosyltransferase involved in cell wall biosynthesis